MDEKYKGFAKRAKQAATGGGGSGLSPDEVAMVAADLRQTTLSGERISLLLIMYYAGDPSYQHLIAPLLDGPNGIVATEALWVLCDCWGLHDQYMDQIRMFLTGVPWDDVGQCQRHAMFLAGEYLHRYPQPQLLSDLINLAEGQGGNEDAQELALSALSTMLGSPHAPPRTDADILQQAKIRLQEELQSP